MLKHGKKGLTCSGGVLMCFPFTVKMLQEDTSSRYVSVFASKYTTSAYPFCLAASCVVNTCIQSVQTG